MRFIITHVGRVSLSHEKIKVLNIPVSQNHLNGKLLYIDQDQI